MKNNMNEINIRKLESESDYDAIYDICVNAWKPVYDYRKQVMDIDIFTSIYKDGEENKANNVKDWCLKNADKVMIATLDDQVAGFITWEEYNSEVVELCNNAVDPSMHRKGVGTTMYNWFLKEMKSRGYLYTFVFTGLDEPHQPAKNAYQKIGFAMPIETVRFYKKL